MVNAIPTLVYVPEWFPGAGWKHEVREWRRRKEQIILDTYQLAKDHMVSHVIPAKMCGRILISVWKFRIEGNKPEYHSYVPQKPRVRTWA